MGEGEGGQNMEKAFAWFEERLVTLLKIKPDAFKKLTTLDEERRALL